MSELPSPKSSDSDDALLCYLEPARQTFSCLVYTGRKADCKN